MNYPEIAQQALDQIRDAGTTATLSRKTGGTFDPVAGTFSAAQDTTTGAIDCVILTYTEKGVRRLITGTIEADNRVMKAFVQGRLRRLLIAGSTAPFEPTNGDVVTGLESATWEVLGCNPLKPDGTTPLLYTVAVERK
jgi:hypothetical protein